MEEFKTMITEFNIFCGKCLDTTLMRKVRKDIENIKDNEYFIIVKCNWCIKDIKEIDSIISYSR